MTQLCLACVVFLATHFVSSTPLRPAAVAVIGEKAWLGLYTVVSFAAIGWMVWAYNRAPMDPLWDGWRLAPAILMPFSFVLLVSGLFTRNPSAVGQAKALKADEPARGILRVTRHPLMWSFMLWAAAHVVARGELKAAVFFGSFLFLAALGARLIDRRKEKTLGEDWVRFAKVTSYFPFAAIAAGRNRLDLGEIGARNILLGLAIYGVLFWAHPLLFGARAY